MRRVFHVGARGSGLSVVQAEAVAESLRRLSPGIEFCMVKITTSGDHHPQVPLVRLAGEGIFVKELEEALLDRRIDLAVHSLKDVPTKLPDGLVLAAVPKREDPRDVFVSPKGGLDKMPAGSKIGTGSPRRAVQLLKLRPDLQVAEIRGNVDTRLRKAASGEFDGVILAAAGLARLGALERAADYLPAGFLPAVGQGALGLEIRSDDVEAARIVSALNHAPSFQAVSAERAFLLALGGGCRAPIAALAVIDGPALRLEGMIASQSKREIIRGAVSGEAARPEEAGNRLARELLSRGAAEFVAEVKANETW